MLIEFKWERISNAHNSGGGANTYRAKVIGGWLVNNNTYTDVINKGNERSLSESMVFVPDPNHEWKIKSEPS